MTKREKHVEEPDAFRIALAWIRDERLPWKLVRAIPDGLPHKVTFCFTAEERQDVRDARKELGHLLGMRVELRQVGRRDLARTLGGVGRCGRELCCSTFLAGYPKVSIRQAKDQNLALSPDKTSGVCGGTLCCLAFEHETYLERRKWLPRAGRRARTTGGLEGKVVGLDILKQTFVLRDERGRRHPLTANDWEGNAGKTVPPPLVVARGEEPDEPLVAMPTRRDRPERPSDPPKQEPRRGRRRRRRRKKE